MRLIATCMASNESDIIEAFVRHNLRFVDAIVVLDHASVDPTLEILRNLAAEGLPITVLLDPDRPYFQSERMTFLTRRYLAELNADFCFALDADEFLKVPSRVALEAALSALPAGHHGLIALQNYVAAEAGNADPNPAKRLTRRLRQERAVSRKVVARREFAADEALRLSMGNHAAVRIRDGRVEPLQHALVPDVSIAHFPVRSPEQVAKKALLGWLAYRLSDLGRTIEAQGAQGPAWHWREIYTALMNGATIDAKLLGMATAVYLGGREPGSPIVLVDPAELVADPMPCEYELRYAARASSSPLSTLSAWADQLVSDVNAGKLAPRKA